jgi:hypothetical protein
VRKSYQLAPLSPSRAIFVHGCDFEGSLLDQLKKEKGSLLDPIGQSELVHCAVFGRPARAQLCVTVAIRTRESSLRLGYWVDEEIIL